MEASLDLSSVHDYRLFLRIKQLPKYRIAGRACYFPDEYAFVVGLAKIKESANGHVYKPIKGMFDYQRAIAALAIRKHKFAVFADCGLGKTLIFLEFARHAAKRKKRVLIVSPSMVCRQTLAEASRWYGARLPIEHVPANRLGQWMHGREGIGITNYEAITDAIPQGNIGALILDESSMLKSHYGKWGTRLIELGKGLAWKLCLTGTPAPNDRIEYANHAVFLDQFPTVNSFLARFFVNRGQTCDRWELKPHALAPFYRALSHWCIFLTNPATYGWKDSSEPLPPIQIHIHEVGLTGAQAELLSGYSGSLFVGDLGGITSRSTLGQIAKGSHNGKSVATLKPEFIRKLVASWPDESTLIWCLYNREQQSLERALPDAASIDGATPHDERQRIIEEFQAGKIRTLISKPKILGFGLNLQIATRHVFSGLQDSYESFYQAVKRSNRFGATRPLNVHIPVTEVERPMIETVLRKANRVQHDTEEQERIFKEHGLVGR